MALLRCSSPGFGEKEDAVRAIVIHMGKFSGSVIHLRVSLSSLDPLPLGNGPFTRRLPFVGGVRRQDTRIGTAVTLSVDGGATERGQSEREEDVL